MVESQEVAKRVNGALLPQFNGRLVVLLGTVRKVDSTGMSVVMNTSDNQGVQVKFQQPLQENVEGVIEVHGRVEGRQIMCEEYINFPSEMTENFDMEMYDEAIRLMYKNSDL